MTKLSDTQSIILSAAAQRPDGNVLPLPGSLRGGAADKVVAALLTPRPDPRAGDRQPRARPTRRSTRSGATSMTAAACCSSSPPPASEPSASASGDAPTRPPERRGGRTGPPCDELPTAGAEAPPAARPGPRTGKVREGTKQARLIAMLKRPEGATIAQVVEATGWQPHTVRGAFAGALKKRLGLEVTSEKVEERGRVYRIAG